MAGSPEAQDGSLPDEAFMLAQLTKTCEAAWQLRISKSDVDEWLSNFSGEVHDVEYERQLALWLLVNFVYYNQDEVMHLCRVLFRRFLHSFLIADGGGPAGDVKAVTAKLLAGTLFYQLGRPGESGGFILYLFRQANDLPTGSFVTPHDRVPTEIDRIVFVDDVCLSGLQAEPYLKQAREYFPDQELFLLTLLDTPEAKELLLENNVPIVSGHTLDERAKCFSPRSDTFAGYRTHQPAAEEFARHYGGRAYAKHPLGYNKDGYAFGFFYNTPDNSLPIFWSEEEGWKPILKRYHKTYGTGGTSVFDPYV